MTKIYEETNKLVEKLSSNHHQIPYDSTGRKPTLGVLQMDAFNTIFSQIVTLSTKMQSLGVKTHTNA